MQTNKQLLRVVKILLLYVIRDFYFYFYLTIFNIENFFKIIVIFTKVCQE